MLYFIWSLLNLAALVWFLFICFSNLTGIKEKLGLVSTIIFIVCCLSFIKESLSNKSQVFPVNPEISGQTVKTFNINNELFFNLDLIYGQQDSLNTGLLGVTVTNGFVIGHEWKPELTKVFFKEGILRYVAFGNHEWRFLGLTLYTAPEKFSGTIK